MAEAGKVYLGVKLKDSDFLSEVSQLAASASKTMQQKLGNIDFSSITKGIDKMGSSLGKAIKDQTSAIDHMSDQLQQGVADSLTKGAQQGAASAGRIASNIQIPKIKVELDEAQLNEQLNIYSQKWEAIDNQRIAQAKKVAEIRKQIEESGSNADLEAQLGRAQEKLANLKLEASKADSVVFQLEQTIENLGNSTGAEEAAEDVQNISSAANEANTSTGGMGDNFKRATKEAAALGTAGIFAGKQISSGMKNAKNSTNLFHSATQKASGGIKKMIKIGLGMMGIRSLMLGLRRVVNSVGESFQTMAKTNAGLANSLAGISNATTQMKGAFAAAVAPLVQSLIPVLQKVVEWLTKAFNATALFFGALTGKKTVQIATGATGAIADNLGGAGSAASGATKEVKKLKRSLAGFDEIEILSFDKDSDGGGGSGGGGSGGSGTAAPTFSEVETGIGPVGEAMNKLAEKVKAFWDKLKIAAEPTIDAIERLKKALEPLKTFVFTGLKDFYEKFLVPVGKWVLGTGLPRLIDGLRDLVESVDWKSLNESFARLWDNLAPLAKAIGEGLLQFYERVLIPISKWVLGEGLPRLLDIISDLASKIDFEKIQDAFNRLWDAIEPFAENIGEGILWFMENILSPLTEWAINDLVPAFLDLLSSAIEALNKVIDALKPLGQWLYDNFLKPLAEWTGGVIVSVLEELSKTLTSIGDWVTKHKPIVETFAIVLGSFAAAWGLVTAAVAIWNIVSGVGTAATTALGGAVAFLTSPITIAIAAIGAIIAVGILLYKNWDVIKEKAAKLGDKISEVWDNIKKWTSEKWQAVKDSITGAIDGAKQSVQNALNKISDKFSWLKDDIEGVFDGLKTTFNGIVDFITGVFSGNWEQAWNGVKEIFSGIWESLKGLVAAPLNYIIDGLNWFTSQLNKIKIPDWVPGIGGKGINIPQMSHIQLARGGVVEQPTMALVGEAGKEAVMPLERNTGWITELADKLSERGGGGQEMNVTIPVYLGTDTLISTIEAAIDREGRLRNKPVFN